MRHCFIFSSLTFLIASTACAQTSVRFSCVGDYGRELAVQSVANFVASKNPDFVVTVGDNNYTPSDTTVQAWDDEIGQYYGQFIRYPAGSASAFAPGCAVNKFFPALGNHDWDAGISGWQNYFELPGNERYYDVVKGPVHLFFIDSDGREQDGNTSSSVQGLWLQQRLASSTSSWKIVLLHHPPFSSSSTHGNTPNLQWPFAAWGASLVLAGHDHTYERIMKNGFPYVVNGLGGRPLYAFRETPEDGSAVRYNENYGAVFITATTSRLTLTAYSIANVLIDSLSLPEPPTPITLTSFVARFVPPNRVRLDWTTLTELNNYGFDIQRRQTPDTMFTTIPNSFLPGHGTTNEPHTYTYTDMLPAFGSWWYRLRQYDLDGTIHYIEPVNVRALTVSDTIRLPSAFRLEQNYPNPFNPKTTIAFSLARAARVTLTVFDELGRESITLIDEMRDAGRHEVEFNTRILASGTYFYRLDADGVSETKRLVLLK
jgi:3',5'-cyclic AMP phosphodiesterase CpdA